MTFSAAHLPPMWHPRCALCKDRIGQVSIYDRYDLMQFVYRAQCHGRTEEFRLTYEEAGYMTQAALPEYAFEEDKQKLETKTINVEMIGFSPKSLRSDSIEQKGREEKLTYSNLPKVEQKKPRMISLED